MIDGSARNVTSLESALITLVRKTYEQPARLISSDLSPVREIVGGNALDYALVIASFHFINRIADLLDVPQEALPKPLRKFEFLRRLNVRLASVLMAKMDLANRDYSGSYEKALGNLAPIFDRASRKTLESQMKPVQSRPKLVEVLQLLLEERDIRCSLDHTVLGKIQRTVETALPSSIDEAEGFHPIPKDPVEAFAFIGTRYAYRTTKEMIITLRREGFDDLGILDLAVAVADANLWARLFRLVGLEAELFYIGVNSPKSSYAVI